MDGMAVLATFLGGLGLFLTGVTGLSNATRRLAGPRLRRIVAAGVSSPRRAALAGFGAGLITQSTIAVTAAAGGLVGAGAITLRQALPLLSWTNVGTTGVALLAALDLRSASLILLGVGAVLPFFRLDLRGRLAPLLALLLALGMQLLGASLMKAGLTPLRESELVGLLLQASAAGSLIAGAAVAFVATSSSAASVLAIALAVSGVLDLPHAALVIAGGSAGSGLAQVTAASGGDADARRAALYQGCWKAACGLILAAIVAAEAAGVGTLLAAARALSDGVAGQVALVVALAPVVTALAAAPLHAFAADSLARRVPEAPEADLARPRFVSDASLRDPPTALDLARREQQRLLARLPLYLDAVRPEAAARPPAGIAPATAALEAAIERHLSHVQETSPEAVEAAAILRNRNATLAALREATTEVASAALVAEGPVRVTILTIVEALHALLEEAAEAEPVDAGMLADRTLAMDALRRRVTATGLDAAAHDALFRATDAFARAVWLMRRLAG